MSETALTVQDAKNLRRAAVGESAAVALTALATLFYGFLSAAAWMHGNIFFGSGLAVFCGGMLLIHRHFLKSRRRLREACRRAPAFPAARLLKLPRR